MSLYSRCCPPCLPDDAWSGWQSPGPRWCSASSWSSSASTRWTAARPSGGCSTSWWGNTTSWRGQSTMSQTPLSSHSASHCSKLSMWWVFFYFVNYTHYTEFWELGAVSSTSFNYWWKQWSPDAFISNTDPFINEDLTNEYKEVYTYRFPINHLRQLETANGTLCSALLSKSFLARMKRIKFLQQIFG